MAGSALGASAGTLRDGERRLVEDNIGLARHLARRFARGAPPGEDLLQTAMLGLVEAARRFDAAFGVPFSAFATKTILGELKRHRRDTGWATHVDRRTKELALRLRPAVDRLTEELRRGPTIEELAGHLGVTAEACLEAMDAGRAQGAESLAADRGADALVDAVTGFDAPFGRIEERTVVGEWLGRLDEVERQVVVAYFWEELSQAEIARRLDTNQMAVSRLLARSLQRMRRWAD